MTGEDTTLFFDQSSNAPDKEEDTRYENPFPDQATDSEIDPEQTLGLAVANHIQDTDTEFIYSSLFHRYNYEIGRKDNLRSLVVFILTAIGFLITVGIGILGVNWVNNNPLALLPIPVYLLLLPVPVCLFFAIKVLIMVEGNRMHLRVHSREDVYFWEHPDNSFVEACEADELPVVDRSSQCRLLATVVAHNSEKNNKARKIGNIALTSLIISIGLSIIFFVCLVFAC